MSNINIRKPRQWQPPERPSWVQRVNEEGYCMDISGIVPLDENSLIETAIRNTGLGDFGADDWREPFRVLIKSLEEDAGFNLMGRIQTRSDLLLLLEARLRIEDTYKRHPEIEDEQIVQPIFVIGQGRSGTSLLLNVLAANPDNGTLMRWETMFPCPPPTKETYRSDPRIEKAHKLADQRNRVTPTITSMYEFGGNVPMEDASILALNFMSTSWFGAMGGVSSYDAYMATQDMKVAFRYHKRVLKLLQHKNPREHWVLKDPIHLDRLADILQVYPDACIVWPHRDPVRALASMISLIGTSQWGRTDFPFKGGALEYVTDPGYSARRLNAAIDQLEGGVVPSRQIYHVLYRDLLQDTMGTLEAIYRHFGLRLSNAGRKAMAQYMIDHPRDDRPPHKVSMSPEDVSDARQAYKRYQDHFQIPPEQI